jgi:CO/xanthine dehydrogenase Mo-binding subunit
MSETEPQAAALPRSLEQNPQLDDWIRIESDGTVTVRTGKVELGQGVLTALAMIAADELDVELARIRVQSADSASAPNEWVTVGSMSIEQSGSAVRVAAAHARALLLQAAAAQLGADLAQLSVQDGTVRAAGSERTVDYWQLHGGKRFGCAVRADVRTKRPQEHTVVGRRAPRLDLPAKLLGAARFVTDLARPGMRHARVVRPALPGAQLVACDIARAAALPGVVKVVRDGSFLAVIAEREEQAIAAAEQLRNDARFAREHALPSQEGLHQRLAANLVGSYPLVNGTPTEAPVPEISEPEGARTTLRATYTRPYVMHGSIGPSAALATFADGKLEVYSSSQGVALLAPVLARVLGLAASAVRVEHVEGAGCYGHNGSDDAALDAALCAREVPGRPVLLKWTRADEHGSEPYGPAMRVDVQASLDAEGRLLDWNHDVYSTSHMGRPVPFGRSCAMIAAQQLAAPWPAPKPRPSLMPQAGIHRNAEPLYALPHARVVKHLSAEMPLRTSSLRSLGAFTNVFAIESMIDELAAAAGKDPIAFRLQHLRDARARAVIEAGAERFAAAQTARSVEDPQRPRGRGMGFARYENYKCYAAVFVELEVDLSSFAIRLLRAVIAADAGQVIDLDGLSNQLEGGFVQAASWTLKEQVTYDPSGVTSLDWVSYPILTFEEVPEVQTVILDRPDQPPRGAGEASTGPTPAAIANAVFAATGARLRELPLSPARLRAALYG